MSRRYAQSPRASLAPLATLACLLLALHGCTLAPPAASNPDWSALRSRLATLDHWQLQGRVNVRYEGESHTPRIRWQQSEDDYQIRLWGTFNAGNTLISGTPKGVKLETDGRTSNARTPERLVLNELGYELPVSALNYWIKGLPAPRPRSQIAFDESNLLAKIRQDGWTVRYLDLRQYGSLTLPRRIELSRDDRDIRLLFIGLNWTLPESTGSD